MANIRLTGANRGSGLQSATQLAARGDRVLATCRTPSEALSALDVTVLDGVDVTDDASVAQLMARVGEQLISAPLHGLINNAGVLLRDTPGGRDLSSVRTQFEVNSMGPLRVSLAALPLMGKGSKVAIITSRMGSVTDNTSGGAYGYRMSKAAVNAFGKSLSIDLKPMGIAVGLFHPGWVRTDMTGGNGLVDAEESAAGLIARYDELTLEGTGSFVHMNGDALPW